MSCLLFAIQFTGCYLVARFIERKVAAYKSRRAHERIMAYGAYMRRQEKHRMLGEQK